MNADGNDQVGISSTKAYSPGHIAWAPEGGSIAYSYAESTYSEALKPSLYIWNIDSATEIRLTDPDYADHDPSWSSDGSMIVFGSSRPDLDFQNAEWIIYIINADGSRLASLFEGYMPEWSPDGTRIAFASEYFENGNPDICIMDAAGGNVKRLTTDSASDLYPCWSPDGTKLAFSSKRDGNWNIYVMNSDGSGITRITKNRASDIYPSWSK